MCGRLGEEAKKIAHAKTVPGGKIQRSPERIGAWRAEDGKRQPGLNGAEAKTLAKCAQEQATKTSNFQEAKEKLCAEIVKSKNFNHENETRPADLSEKPSTEQWSHGEQKQHKNKTEQQQLYSRETNARSN
jgi:long-subunit acyl-CoA synthetase (AMP-forming)